MRVRPLVLGVLMLLTSPLAGGAVEVAPGIANPSLVPGQGPDARVQGRCMASFIFFMALSRSAIDAGLVPAHQVNFYETIAFAANRYWHRTRDEVDASTQAHHDLVVSIYQDELIRYQGLATSGGQMSISAQADEVGTCAAVLGYIDG